MLTEVPDRAGALHFSHALVREVLVEDLSSVRRLRLHLAVADALEARGHGDDDAELLAEHLWAAGPLVGGDRVAAALEAAAEVAVRRFALPLGGPPARPRGRAPPQRRQLGRPRRGRAARGRPADLRPPGAAGVRRRGRPPGARRGPGPAPRSRGPRARAAVGPVGDVRHRLRHRARRPDRRALPGARRGQHRPGPAPLRPAGLGDHALAPGRAAGVARRLRPRSRGGGRRRTPGVRPASAPARCSASSTSACCSTAPSACTCTTCSRTCPRPTASSTRWPSGSTPSAGRWSPRSPAPGPARPTTPRASCSTRCPSWRPTAT